MTEHCHFDRGEKHSTKYIMMIVRFIVLIALIVCVSSYILPTALQRRISVHRGSSHVQNMFGNIASKMLGVVELLAGQTKITESNIEATLKVRSAQISQCIC
jgi:uncharacterized membrane protein